MFFHGGPLIDRRSCVRCVPRSFFRTRSPRATGIAVQCLASAACLLDVCCAASLRRAERKTGRSDDLPAVFAERPKEWMTVWPQVRACDTLFWMQVSSDQRFPIQLASHMKLRARRSNFIIDAWATKLTKIGIAATLQRLDPCLLGYREATRELQARYPRTKFEWMPYGADTDVFFPSKKANRLSPFGWAAVTSLFIEPCSNIVSGAACNISIQVVAR